MSSSDFVWLPHEDLVWIPAVQIASNPLTFRTIDNQVINVDPNSLSEQLIPVSQVSLSNGSCSNLIQLDDFWEGPVVHELRVRYMNDRIYTQIGTILISINPYKLLPIYTPAHIQDYRNNFSNRDPHVFAIAAEAFSRLNEETINQAIIIAGESGAGKTEATKSILLFLSQVAGSLSDNNDNDNGPGFGNDSNYNTINNGSRGSNRSSQISVEQEILLSNPILEAFGNSKTVRNNNSSRFGKWMEIQFNGSNQIVSAKIINYLLEKSRVTGQSKQERNYHIFYQLLSGAPPGLIDRLGLLSAGKYRYLSGSECLTIPGVSDGSDFDLIIRALDALGFTADSQVSIFTCIAAILQLGQITPVANQSSDGSFVNRNDNSLVRAALSLEVEPASLAQAITFRSVTVRGSMSLIPLDVAASEDARDALAKALYGCLFDWLIKQINIRLYEKSVKTIGILDIFGFEIFDDNRFEQFCINYANEKLQQNFNNHIFKLEQEEYIAEGINVSHVDFIDNIDCLDLIEKKSGLGIISMLDEELVIPKGSDNAWVNKMHKAFNRHKNYSMIKKTPDIFIVKHYAGEVMYNSVGFLQKNKDRLHESLEVLMITSQSSFLQELFKREDDPIENNNSSATLRRRESSQTKRNQGTLASQFQAQLNALMLTLNSSNPHYIRCIKPNVFKQNNTFDTRMVLRQMSYAGLFEAIRIRRAGFPIRKDFLSFIKLYRIIASGEVLRSINTYIGKGDAYAACVLLLNSLSDGGALDPTQYAIGRTKVFLRPSQRFILSRLRDYGLGLRIGVIQARLRGVFARRKVNILKRVARACRSAFITRDINLLRNALRLAEEARVTEFDLPQYINPVEQKLQFLAAEARTISSLEAATLMNFGNGESNGTEIIESINDVIKRAEGLCKSFSVATPPLEPANELIQNLYKCKNHLANITALVTVKTNLRRAIASRDKNSIQNALNEAQNVNSFALQNEMLDAQNALQNILQNQNLQNQIVTQMNALNMNNQANMNGGFNPNNSTSLPSNQFPMNNTQLNSYPTISTNIDKNYNPNNNMAYVNNGNINSINVENEQAPPLPVRKHLNTTLSPTLTDSNNQIRNMPNNSQNPSESTSFIPTVSSRSSPILNNNPSPSYSPSLSAMVVSSSLSSNVDMTSSNPSNNSMSDLYRSIVNEKKGKYPLTTFPFIRSATNFVRENLFFRNKNIREKRHVWQIQDLHRTLVKLSTNYCHGKDKSIQIKADAMLLFKSLRGYMTDIYHAYPVTLGHEILVKGISEPLLRDEIYCQIIKQTTNNPSLKSRLFGFKILYLSMLAFSASAELSECLLSHLASFANPSINYNPNPNEPGYQPRLDSVADIATECLIFYIKNQSETGWIPRGSIALNEVEEFSKSSSSAGSSEPVNFFKAALRKQTSTNYLNPNNINTNF